MLVCLDLVSSCTSGAASHTCTLFGQHQVVDGGREHKCEVIFVTDSIKINLSPFEQSKAKQSKAKQTKTHTHISQIETFAH